MLSFVHKYSLLICFYMSIGRHVLLIFLRLKKHKFIYFIQNWMRNVLYSNCSNVLYPTIIVLFIDIFPQNIYSDEYFCHVWNNFFFYKTAHKRVILLTYTPMASSTSSANDSCSVLGGIRKSAANANSCWLEQAVCLWFKYVWNFLLKFLFWLIFNDIFNFGCSAMTFQLFRQNMFFLL